MRKTHSVLIVPSIYYLKVLSISNNSIVSVIFSTMYKTDTKTKLWFSYLTPVKTQHKKQNPYLSWKDRNILEVSSDALSNYHL